jgi:hypothetical protein
MRAIDFFVTSVVVTFSVDHNSVASSQSGCFRFLTLMDLESGTNGRVQRRAGGQADGLAARKRGWKIASSRKLISMRMATT